MEAAYEPTDMMDRESRSNRYYRNAVERHWDPFEIELEQDVTALVESAEDDPENFESAWNAFLAGIAKFGAGEDAVAEDLAPLAVVMEDLDDQLFLTTQLYEEAKHADFFDRYWREVVWAVEDEVGLERSTPRDDKWFTDEYLELFDRNKQAMYTLLEEDTPENRAIAYSHYHLTLEGIIAQTGYYAANHTFGPDYAELPHLPGLVEGFEQIRSDEGRHVGFGMSQLKKLVSEEGVDPQIIDETVLELMPLLEAVAEDDRFGPPDEDVDVDEVMFEPGDLFEYTVEKHSQRMSQLRDEADLPDVDELVSIES